MEWTRIEAKWHDIARRLQHASPVSRQQIGTTTEITVLSGTKAQTEPDLCETDEASARAGV